MEAAAQEVVGQAEQTDKRGAHRHTAENVPSISSVRISPLGIQARLVDISETGVLVECSTRIQPRSVVNLSFEGTSAPPPVGGRVARTTVAALDGSGSLRYHVGIAFTAPISLVGRLAQVTATPARPAAETPAPILVPPPPHATPVRAVPRNRW